MSTSASAFVVHYMLLDCQYSLYDKHWINLPWSSQVVKWEKPVQLLLWSIYFKASDKLVSPYNKAECVNHHWLIMCYCWISSEMLRKVDQAKRLWFSMLISFILVTWATFHYIVKVWCSFFWFLINSFGVDDRLSSYYSQGH